MNRSHPDCGYAHITVAIGVSLDVEGMQPGEQVCPLGSEDPLGLLIFYTDASAGNPPDEQFHNADGSNLQQNSPLCIERDDENPDQWRLWVDSNSDYMSYAEFYYTNIGAGTRGRGKHLVPDIPLAAYGPFGFEMTWTRLVGN